MKQHPYILFLLYLLLGSINLTAQNPHPYFRNYNTDHGLPSSEVHYALQDDDGYMWFATDNGLSRFDGYTFKNYGRKEGLKNNVIFHLQKAPDGKIWMATMSGNLYFAEGDSIVAYEQNKLIRYHLKNETITDFLIDSAATIYLCLNGVGILQIKINGRDSLIQASNPLGGYIVLETNGGPILHSYTRVSDFPLKKHQKTYSDKTSSALEWHREKKSGVEGRMLSPKEPKTKTHIKASSNGHYLLYISNYLYEIIDKKVVWKKAVSYNSQLKAVIETDEYILTGILGGLGLRRYKNMDARKNEVYDQFLEGKSVSHIFKDQQRNFWISTLEHGVFYCPDFEQKIYDRSFGFPNEDVRCMAFKNKNEGYFAFRTGETLLLQTASKPSFENFISTPKKQDIIYDLYFDKNENRLWAAAGHIKYMDKKQWNSILYFNQRENFFQNLTAKRITLGQDEQSLWTSSRRYFGKVNIPKKEVTFSALNIGIDERIFITRESKNGQVWVGKADGLFEYKNEQLIRPNPFRETFTTRIDDIAETADSMLVICTKGDGVLLWKDPFFLQLTTKNGLLTDMIENVHIDQKGRIWIGTLQGLNRITFSNRGNYSNPKVEQFTIWHGLPSNEINQVRSNGNQIWIATTRGLLKWNEPKKNTSIKPPVFRKLLVNNQAVDFNKSAYFTYDQNDFNFEFVSINFRLNGNVLYRYRLDNKLWSETRQTSINFARLSAGQYTFEVQSQNEDGIWSDAAIFSFTILAPWWQQWWFYGIVLLTLSISGLAIYRHQMAVFKKEYELKDQVMELEKKALQAQMNPHFIFNCLTSIQRLVMDKETENAMRYLSRFSKLVRGILDASVDGEVSLEEEVEMLKSYLQLEKLRFKSAFEYEIIVDPSLDVFETTFPSMLLQPYVENAIIHGMQGKNGNGKITIHFQNYKNKLVATISDNGGGMTADSKLNPLHKSVGMSITSHRLQLLHEGEEKDFVQISDILDKENVVLGLKVRVVLN